MNEDKEVTSGKHSKFQSNLSSDKIVPLSSATEGGTAVKIENKPSEIAVKEELHRLAK